MNFASLMISFWVLSTTSLFLFVDAKLDHSFISESYLSSSKEPFFLFSSNMEAHSPGTPVVEVVHHQDLNKRILIALIVASTLLAGILFSLACFWIYRINSLKSSTVKANRNSVELTAKNHSPNLVMDKFGSARSSQRKGSVEVMEFHLLEAATNHFEEDNVLGEGHRGRVYKAHMNENLLAAVKRMEGVGQDVQVEFENEVNWLVKIRHQNIIALLGCCIHAEAHYIVYEMVQNGSLDSQLHGPTHGSALSWNLRMKIAVDIARGLEYLHEHCNPPVVHRDLKSSNILLDSNFNAKLSDFGLAVTSGIQNKNIKLSGTSGYVAPEYILDGELTDKSDVYAFGVVLLELLIGKKPVEKTKSEECQSLVTWAMPQLTDRSKLPNIVDPVIRDTMDLKHLYQVAAVAVLCVQQESSYRPLITDVLHSLIPLVPLELGGSLRVTEPAPPSGYYHQ